MTSRHAEVIATIADALHDAPGVRALFLSGSHGNGLADAYSDIDFVMVAADGPSDAVAELWRDAVARTGDIVLLWDRNVRPALINAITADWTRTDVVIVKPDQVGTQAQDSLKSLSTMTASSNAFPRRPRRPASILHGCATRSRSSSALSACCIWG